MKKLLALILLATLFVSCSSNDDDEPEQPKITSIKIENLGQEVYIGGEYQLKVTHTPADLTAPAYTWESSNPDIATIDNNGKLKALKEGQTTIKITTSSLNLTSSLTVSVLPIQATSIKLDKQTNEITTGESFTLTYKIEPENTTNKSVSWKTSDENIATVSKDGLVTAVSDGDVTITVSLGNLSDECKVKIKPIKVSGIILDKTSITLERTEKQILTATVLPENAKNKNITWSSSNEKIAKIDNDGNIEAISIGNAIITATTKDGNFKAECAIIVKPISVKNIKLFPDNLTMLVGTASVNAALTYNIQPLNADNQKISTNNSNPNIATWNAGTGVVTAHNVGKTIITVKTDDGGHEANCTINVLDITGFVDISFGSSSTININGKITAKVRTSVSNSSSKGITDVKIGIRSFSAASPLSFTPIGNIDSYQNASFDLNINSVYRPIVVCKFQFEGKEYLIEKEFTTN